MAEGFPELLATLNRLPSAALEAGGVAVTEGFSRPCYDLSQEYVPVDTGTLRDSGRIMDPVTNGTEVTGGVSYGNEATVTTWHGVGYELFNELGTGRMPANPFLSLATSQAAAEAPVKMAPVFQRELAARLR